MNSAPILQEKHAVVFGAGGSIGAAVAKEFAAEGAEVFLAGRTKSNVEEVTKEITAAGGRAHEAVIDALDDAAVNEYIDATVKQTGSIDIVFNAVGPLAKEYGNGKNALPSYNCQHRQPNHPANDGRAGKQGEHHQGPGDRTNGKL